MRVTVSIPGRDFPISINNGSTIADALEGLNIDSSFTCTVDGEPIEASEFNSYQLAEGSRVTFAPSSLKHG